MMLFYILVYKSYCLKYFINSTAEDHDLKNGTIIKVLSN